MEPLVFEELREDLFLYGRCNFSIKDTDSEFAIRRESVSRDYFSMELI